MGISCSCPFSESNDLESGFESIIVRSISFGNDDQAKTTTRSISFSNRKSLEPMIMKSALGSGKMMIEGSISFKNRDNETKISITEPPASPVGTSLEKSFTMDDPGNNLKHEAAVTLQKVYKSFRVRRKIADCAVQLVEQRWWQLLDYAELKRSSVSVDELDDQHETAISKWARAKIRAAKSLLFAAGLRPTPAQATIVSWILKDGMQHVGKLICSNLGAKMDSNLRSALWPSEEAARSNILSIWDQADIIKVSEDEIKFLTCGEDPYDDNVVLTKLFHPNRKLLIVTEGSAVADTTLN